MQTLRTGLIGIVLGAVLAVLGVAVAIATPPSGVDRTDVGRGTLKVPGSTSFNNGTDVVVNNAVLKPGGTTGWHTHPGVEIEIVKSGTVTLYEAESSHCAPQTLTKGQALVGSGRPHMGRNDGKEPAELLVIYVNVPAGGSPRGEAEAPPGCPAS